MFIKKATKVLALCLLVAFMSSCQTQEEKVISKMQALSERVQDQSDSFTDSQWEDIYTEFESLQTQAKECDFTAEQLKEMSAAEVELTAAIARQKAKELGNDISDIINEGEEIVNGVIEGFKDGLGIGDNDAEKAPDTK